MQGVDGTVQGVDGTVTVHGVDGTEGHSAG